MDNTTSEDVHRSCHNVFRGHENLKMQKFVHKLLENVMEIQCCFPPKETRLHKRSLSWQAIVNLLDFCVLRLP